MSACLQLREPGIARVRRWCLQRVSRACPVGWSATSARGSWRPSSAGRPWRWCAGSEWTRFPITWLRYTRGHQGLGAAVSMGHLALKRAIGHAEANDLVSRNVATLADTPKASKAGPPSPSPWTRPPRSSLPPAPSPSWNCGPA